jgi:hypothetical protein
VKALRAFAWQVAFPAEDFQRGGWYNSRNAERLAFCWLEKTRNL